MGDRRGAGTQVQEPTARVVALFDELIHRGEQIKQSCTRQYFSGQKKGLTPEQFGEWRANCLSLLRSTFGSCSPQYAAFTAVRVFDHYNATQVYLGILRGARGDLEKGYFFHKELMLSVNIYNALLERVEAMLERGDVPRAAGVLEALLLEILEKICESRKVALPPGDAREGLDALCLALGRAQVIRAEAQARLREIGRLVRGEDGSPNDTVSLKAAVGWVASFVEEQLGASVLVLN